MWALESLFALMGLCRVESLWQAKNAWVYLSLSYNINVSSVRTRISFPVCIAYLSKLQKISVDSMTLSYLSCLNITFINIVVLAWIFKRQITMKNSMNICDAFHSTRLSMSPFMNESYHKIYKIHTLALDWKVRKYCAANLRYQGLICVPEGTTSVQVLWL